MTFVINLPFPPSLNSANNLGRDGQGNVRVFSSPAKTAFFKDADGMFWEQKKHLRPVRGRFTFHITLNEKDRNPLSDGDNRGKYVLDYLQRVDLIDNDKLAQSGSWSWGPCEFGCQVIVKEYDPSINRVPETSKTESAHERDNAGRQSV